MKTEVLNDIKKTEAEYQSMISAAQEEKKKRHTQAELEAGNLITKAQSNAEQYKTLKLDQARHQAAQEHAGIVNAGKQRAAALKERGKSNLSKAVQLLVSRFREQLHVNS